MVFVILVAQCWKHLINLIFFYLYLCGFYNCIIQLAGDWFELAWVQLWVCATENTKLQYIGVLSRPLCLSFVAYILKLNLIVLLRSICLVSKDIILPRYTICLCHDKSLVAMATGGSCFGDLMKQGYEGNNGSSLGSLGWEGYWAKDRNSISSGQLFCLFASVLTFLLIFLWCTCFSM